MCERSKRKKNLHSYRMLLHVESLQNSLLAKYQVLLPTEEAHHSFHETKGEACYAQFNEIVSEGITDTQEVKRALKHYTLLHVLCPEQKPELVDMSLLPNKYWYQESCVQGTTSMPAVKVGLGKSPTKNRTVAKTNPTVSHSHYYSMSIKSHSNKC